MDRSTETKVAVVLKSLLREAFRRQVAFASTPSVLRHALSATDEVRMLREALRSGAISDSEVREFVD